MGLYNRILKFLINQKSDRGYSNWIFRLKNDLYDIENNQKAAHRLIFAQTFFETNMSLIFFSNSFSPIF